MGSRERKRAQRRKRKRRTAERPPDEAPPAGFDEEPDGMDEAPSASVDEALDAGNGAGEALSRSQHKDAEARASLEPLHEGERPLVVTIGATVAALIALSIVVAYAAGAEVSGDRPSVSQVVAPAVLMVLMAWGMWRARYWAVLGFQVVLVFLILAASLGLVQAANAVQVAGNLVLLAIAGTFFYFMVKGLARIQMPERLPPK